MPKSARPHLSPLAISLLLSALASCASIESRWSSVSQHNAAAILRFKETESLSPEYQRVAPQVDEALDRLEWTSIEQEQDIDRARLLASQGLTQKYRSLATDYARYLTDHSEFVSLLPVMMMPNDPTFLKIIDKFLSVERTERIRKELEPRRQGLLRWDAWARVRKDSCRAIRDFQKSFGEPAATPDSDVETLKKTAETEFFQCVDRKLTAHVSRRFPAQAAFLNTGIVFSDGTAAEIKLVELFRGLLGRNPASGARMDDSMLVLETEAADRFRFLLAVPGEQPFIVSFRMFGQKLNCVGLRRGFEVNPRNWELAAFAVFRTVSNYPGPEYWDFDWIDRQ